ncbi:FAD-dependent monooxygenase [Pararhizobium sp. YC-54]|uniref:FAD-dependent monooxygenase n=1 Tax=Pararhizobium sp. YC-54 TaxID=2986920 RepID=UPI0021F7639F|nr:FAD-dependent monooxygenase [Pararhizobium sp. YC-54]MCV9997191.1 FAD-dependent monooxygenase [Pararhizobium sp. YC-54]
MKQGTPVAIAGAGIAGLTAALSFARKGIPTEIFERTGALKEAGAGLQLSPNATRILTRLGLAERLERVWSEPETINLVDGSSLRTIAAVPSGTFARGRWHAPYGVLHRADLQTMLLDAVNANPLCRLYLGQQIESPNSIAEITGTESRLIVGADGVWSSLRQHVQGAGKAAFSGNVAWRLTLGEANAPVFFDAAKVTAFLGNGSHLVVYPLPQKHTFNIVAITSGADPGKTWDSTLPPDEVRHRLLDAFSGWHPGITGILQTAVEPTTWPLYEVSAGAWHRGDEVVLIGDAAHAMMPFAAQGAAMAIEDAFELASFVAGGQSLAAFADHRRSRVARVRSRGAFNRFAYHARGPIRLGRDLVLSLRRSESLAAEFDWLYGYEPKD